MADKINIHGIKESLMKDLRELNGFHEITDRELRYITEPEWQTLLSRHYPGMNLHNRSVRVDFDSETIVLE